VVRGVNVFPSALEGIVRRFPAVDEFMIEVYRRHEMDEVRLLLEVEAGASIVAQVQEAVRVQLGIRVEAVAVPARSLPRWELKARRVVRRTGA
jgi:phenylacetate-CoA ligase